MPKLADGRRHAGSNKDYQALVDALYEEVNPGIQSQTASRPAA